MPGGDRWFASVRVHDRRLAARGAEIALDHRRAKQRRRPSIGAKDRREAPRVARWVVVVALRSADSGKTRHDQTGYRPSFGCRRVRCHGKVIRAHTIRMSVAAVSTYTGHGPNRSSSVAVAGFLLMKP